MRNGYHPSHRNSREKETLKEQGFYHTPAWRRVRILALQRDHYLCQECLRQHRFTAATEVHHILPLEEHPELALELSNLRSLCWSCHEATKQHKKVSAPLRARVIKVSDGTETQDWAYMGRTKEHEAPESESELSESPLF